MIIRRSDEVRQFDVGSIVGIEGVKATIKWLINKDVGGDEYGHRFALRYFTMEPGGKYPLHQHFYVEAVYLLSGRLAFCGEDENWVEIKPGDVVYTARREKHALKNTGDTMATFTCTIDCEQEGEPCVEPAPKSGLTAG